MSTRTIDYLRSLVKELSKLPTEVEWAEFKINNKDPERIAKYISGMSNVATLWDKPYAYLVWGIDDETHKIVGTSFDYRKEKHGNQELEAWLVQNINPKINFKFFEILMEDEKTRVVLIEIPCAERETTKYKSTPYIRVGSNLKPLVGFPEKEREIWSHFDQTPMELRFTGVNYSKDEVVQHLDYPKYYELLELPIPQSIDKIIEDFSNDKFIKRNDANGYEITNFGALMFSKNLKEFEGLLKKTVRVIKYRGIDRTEGIQEREFSTGYAYSYEDVVQYVMTIIPQEEILDGTIRKSIYSFPEIAIRELLANALIHQSIEQKGTNPMVEIFSDRIEFSNAGAPLINIERIVDTVPVSRNENIAGYMNKCGICEERGSGYDKIVMSTAKDKLLAPLIINQNNQFTKVVLFAKVPFDLTTKEDRVRTCYMQACLAYVNFGSIGNSDIRDLFDLADSEKVKASRIIKDTVSAGLIKPLDVETAPRYMKYIPFWA